MKNRSAIPVIYSKEKCYLCKEVISYDFTPISKYMILFVGCEVTGRKLNNHFRKE